MTAEAAMQDAGRAGEAGSALVGPIMQTGEMADLVAQAIAEDNPGAEVYLRDEGSYVRIHTPGRCRLTSRTLTALAGRPVRIGDVELGTMPRVAVALSDREVRDDAKRVAPLVDVFELRIDRFSRLEPEYVAQVTGVARGLGVPLLATVRSATEGGEASLSDDERLALLRVVTPWVDAVDIELRSAIRPADPRQK